jgi:hypothetical protein
MAKRLSDKEIAKKAEQIEANSPSGDFPEFFPELNEGESWVGRIRSIREKAFSDGSPAIEVENDKGESYTLRTRKALVNQILRQNGAVGDGLKITFTGMTKGKNAVQPYYNYKATVVKADE